MEKFTLNNGIDKPVIGLGTYPMKGNILIETMEKAIELGYSSFDTATAYKNHEEIGEVINNSIVAREEVFITTKLSNIHQKHENIEEVLKRSLSILGLKYVDMYLIHWPVPDYFLKSWVELEQLYKKGLVRSIGVCNFHEHHLRDLIEIANILPAINQIELHPLLTQKPLIKFCSKYGIKIEAYSPLARMHNYIQNSDILKELADRYQKSIPQIILRWNYQNGVISIPKTQSHHRLSENISIYDFHLSNEEMISIDDINMNFRVRHDPDNCDFDKL
ncbi:aldo/keto reductase [Alkaliphilus pronyensis]|uniref:Aldo/keto reductase n=1 Tax=Alkaliphilus pronyensis TaxID=1482732 RepID=A0A6I0F9M2_9FIRM|nr:aldo/keto reductase [Alkaliphilus pronyensis]KAB3539661.1 aldo/keto reductase [Alkaliphilus pronyensis]